MTKKKSGTKADPLRFDVETLRAAAGDKVFARGQAYFAGGQVEILGIERKQAHARVAGTQIYRTKLGVVGRRISGECSCPAFSDRGDFCKHLVAVALAVNEMEPGKSLPNRFAQIRDHLRVQGVDALVETIMTLAERDLALLRDLELAAATDGKDDDALFSSFARAIAEATRTPGFIEYDEMRAWASHVEPVLARIDGLIGRDRAGLALRLLDQFFACMGPALQSVDDSNGHGGRLLSRGAGLHLKACRAVRPEPVAFARDLFLRETEEEWGTFHGASETYRDLLGAAGLAEYRRLAEAAWADIKPLRGGARRVQDDRPALYYPLLSILESFAARDGDVDAMITIRAKDLSSAYAYLQIAKLCADHDRMADALKWAEDGLWQFEDDPDKRLVKFAADLRHRLRST
jgi:hypothetical protein